jgi:hypothetical protein
MREQGFSIVSAPTRKGAPVSAGDGGPLGASNGDDVESDQPPSGVDGSVSSEYEHTDGTRETNSERHADESGEFDSSHTVQHGRLAIGDACSASFAATRLVSRGHHQVISQRYFDPNGSP